MTFSWVKRSKMTASCFCGLRKNTASDAAEKRKSRELREWREFVDNEPMANSFLWSRLIPQQYQLHIFYYPALRAPVAGCACFFLIARKSESKLSSALALSSILWEEGEYPCVPTRGAGDRYGRIPRVLPRKRNSRELRR